FHINGIHELNDKVDGDTTENANCLWAHLEKVNVLCKTAITFIGSLQLPPLCDYILQATDAGPGVGVSNVEVKYRDVEMSRINEWMHMNRIHRAPHDSSQNEAERPNAAIGEALVDGRALKWEYFKPADIMNEEEFKKLTVAEIKKLEAETMERNAWKVSEEVVSRIDGEPGPAGDCMKAFVTKKNDQQFFFNTEYLHKYNAGKSEKKKVQVPGHHYFKKIDSIIATCMSSGEMFHEYCVDQAVPPTPRPVPDITKLPKFHYLPLQDTPIRKENGNRREVDDFHPRARLRALHKEKAINVEDALSVKAFCNKYIVEENLVNV
ncbi:RNA-directed DNA polymerase from transposon X-element, partial [Paramuricea clavata]